MTRTSTNPFDQDPGPTRSFALLGVILGVVGTFGLLFFWIIAAVGVVTGNGGLIVSLQLDGAWLIGYWAYPLVAFVAAPTAGVLYTLGRDQLAVAAAGAPIGLFVLYYLVLNLFR